MKKPNINKAFNALRKAGYFARQNFWCCQNCGWSAMSDEEAKKAVFYHAQDKNDLDKSGSCHIAWSGDGNEIVKIFNDNGVYTKWCGNNDKRIQIFIEKPIE